MGRGRRWMVDLVWVEEARKLFRGNKALGWALWKEEVFARLSVGKCSQQKKSQMQRPRDGGGTCAKGNEIRLMWPERSEPRRGVRGGNKLEKWVGTLEINWAISDKRACNLWSSSSIAQEHSRETETSTPGSTKTLVLAALYSISKNLKRRQCPPTG